ncbi:MAG TPA: restriction endonuclease [Candidatus Paceibacterota bacterium]|nr:restriction endonuclease [Candidatus Paceibacterota bacterium]
MSRELRVIKADGEEETFDPSKLEASLARAGASSAARAHIIAHMMKALEPAPLTTSEIYRRAFELLKKREGAPVAARYSIKRAIFDLGPSGYPFEQFFAEVMRSHGWQARHSVILTGRCVTHEVDVLAKKGGKRIGIEAKFHNTPGIKTDVKDALYVRARYQDLAEATDPDDHVDQGWLVTNTRFTEDAIRYGECAGLPMISWDYPRRGNLLELIEEGQVHPLTALTTLSPSEKQRLLDSRIVLCRAVGGSSQLLREHGVKPQRIPEIQDEARKLCGA